MSLVKHFELEDEKPQEEVEAGELVEEFDPDENVKEAAKEAPVVEEVKKYEQARPSTASRPFNGTAGDAGSAQFQTVVTQLVQQHREDKKRLFELLEMFQKRILVLEDQLKQLEPPKRKKRRFLFW